MTDALLVLPAHLRRRLTDALEAGVLAVPPTLASLQSVLGVRVGGEDVVEALTVLRRMGISGPACAAWIRTVEEAAGRTPRPDLVRARGAQSPRQRHASRVRGTAWVGYALGPSLQLRLLRRAARVRGAGAKDGHHANPARHALAEHPAPMGRHECAERTRAAIRRPLLGNGLAWSLEAGSVLRPQVPRAAGTMSHLPERSRLLLRNISLYLGKPAHSQRLRGRHPLFQSANGHIRTVREIDSGVVTHHSSSATSGPTSHP